MDINSIDFSTILYTAMIAFFGAISKEINDKSKDKNESFSVFFGEVVLHGFSGWIVGLFATKFLKASDIISLTIYAGIGGLFGYDLVKIILKMILTTISKNNKFDETDKKDEDKT